MANNDDGQHTSQKVYNGYTPRSTVPVLRDGKVVQVPVAQVKIIPPTSGTAAITPKK
jgi:hypothetical protein